MAAKMYALRNCMLVKKKYCTTLNIISFPILLPLYKNNMHYISKIKSSPYSGEGFSYLHFLDITEPSVLLSSLTERNQFLRATCSPI